MNAVPNFFPIQPCTLWKWAVRSPFLPISARPIGPAFPSILIMSPMCGMIFPSFYQTNGSLRQRMPSREIVYRLHSFLAVVYYQTFILRLSNIAWLDLNVCYCLAGSFNRRISIGCRCQKDQILVLDDKIFCKQDLFADLEMNSLILEEWLIKSIMQWMQKVVHKQKVFHGQLNTLWSTLSIADSPLN